MFDFVKSIFSPSVVNKTVDGIVKGDEEQVQGYIDACLAIKEKYPKPNEE